MPSEPLFSYGLHKFLHILGVVVFVGNMTVGPLWVIYAWLLNERRHFSFVIKTLSDADKIFTVPGVQLTVWNGVFIAAAMGGVQARPLDG
ncbi:MAG: DUF2269 family protein [Pseudomonadales bacterium]|nr:DUF2269 family protein [Pseudomonadales bacterium]